jgi:hypothetical protein
MFRLPNLGSDMLTRQMLERDMAMAQAHLMAQAHHQEEMLRRAAAAAAPQGRP